MGWTHQSPAQLHQTEGQCSQSSQPQQITTQHSLEQPGKEENSALEQDLGLVTIRWHCGTGQHRERDAVHKLTRRLRTLTTTVRMG